MNVTKVIIDIHLFVHFNAIVQVSTKMLMSTKPTSWEKFLLVVGYQEVKKLIIKRSK